MARKSPIHATLNKILVEYVCLKKATPETVTVEITVDNISSSESECELCGSHGHMTIDIPTCPVCKKYHTIEVKEW